MRAGRSIGIVFFVAVEACGLGSNGANTSIGASAGTSGASSSSGGMGSASAGATVGGTAGGTTATTAAGSTTGASSSGTATGGNWNCAKGLLPCTPANICDEGCAPDGGACLDQGLANGAQTGVACDAGAVCEGTTCFGPSGPQLPNENGGVIAAPNIVMITYANDQNQTVVQNWTVWIADGGFLSAAAGQYGIGNGTAQFVSLDVNAPVWAYDPGNPFGDQQYLAGLFEQGLLPANAANNVYVLELAPNWPSFTALCASGDWAYHSYYDDPVQGTVVYALVADCYSSLTHIEVDTSHEIVEASTDPQDGSWVFSSASPWSFLSGEVADLCESNTSYDTNDAGDIAQYSWSNAAAAAGQVPCQPWPADQLYLTVVSPSSPAVAPPGGSAQVPLTGWASGPTAPFIVAAIDDFGNFGTNFSQSATTVAPGGQVLLTLNVPAEAPGQPSIGGQIGAVWVVAATSNTAEYGGTVAGILAGCKTTADCGNPAFVCQLDGGVGICASGGCGPSAVPLSTCSAQGSNDGVCLPTDAGGAFVEACNQTGTIATGDAGCLTQRIFGAGRSPYCAPQLTCQGYVSPSCFQICGEFEGRQLGTCGLGQVCNTFDTGAGYGGCVQQCGDALPACPSNQGCYFGACLPN